MGDVRRRGMRALDVLLTVGAVHLAVAFDHLLARRGDEHELQAPVACTQT